MTRTKRLFLVSLVSGRVAWTASSEYPAPEDLGRELAQDAVDLRHVVAFRRTVKRRKRRVERLTGLRVEETTPTATIVVWKVTAPTVAKATESIRALRTAGYFVGRYRDLVTIGLACRSLASLRRGFHRALDRQGAG